MLFKRKKKAAEDDGLVTNEKRRLECMKRLRERNLLRPSVEKWFFAKKKESRELAVYTVYFVVMLGTYLALRYSTGGVLGFLTLSVSVAFFFSLFSTERRRLAGCAYPDLFSLFLLCSAENFEMKEKEAREVAAAEQAFEKYKEEGAANGENSEKGN